MKFVTVICHRFKNTSLGSQERWDQISRTLFTSYEMCFTDALHSENYKATLQKHNCNKYRFHYYEKFRPLSYKDS